MSSKCLRKKIPVLFDNLLKAGRAPSKLGSCLLWNYSNFSEIFARSRYRHTTNWLGSVGYWSENFLNYGLFQSLIGRSWLGTIDGHGQGVWGELKVVWTDLLGATSTSVKIIDKKLTYRYPRPKLSGEWKLNSPCCCSRSTIRWLPTRSPLRSSFLCRDNCGLRNF